MKVVLFSTHCPKCEILSKKLNSKNVEFEEINDVKVMTEKGFKTAPMLEVDNTIMNFTEAVKWINNL